MNIYKTSTGKILQRNNMVVEQRDIYAFELEVSGTSFPDRYIGQNYIRFGWTGSNTIYVDCNDGVGERVITDRKIFGGYNLSLFMQTALFFQDVPENIRNTVDPTYSVRRKIKIRFQFPKKVNYIESVNCGVYGIMPAEFGLFNFSTFRISNGADSPRWESFANNFYGLKSDTLFLNNPFSSLKSSIPTWLYSGRFINVSLLNGFNLSGDPTSTNVDKIHNIQDLTSLNIGANMGDNSLADNLKLIPTLRYLGIGGNNFTTLPKAVTNCQYLITLVISNTDGFGYNTNMTSWGDGLVNMTELTKIVYVGMKNNPPSALFPGIENCTKLKTVEAFVTYTTQVKIDDHVNNWYDLIVNNASATTGNTKFRQMSINIGSNVGSIRPSGTYQDSTTPTTPMEKIYKMVKVYGHTWIVRNAANTGTEILAP